MDTDRLDALIEAAVASDLEEVGETATCSAVQAAVVEGGETTYATSAGRTRLDRSGRPVTEGTPFDVASLTKPLVVGTLMMQCAAAGTIDYGDSVWSTLPDWNAEQAAPEVTWEQLANHTSGLPDWRPLYRDLPLDPDRNELEQNREAIDRRIRETPLEAPPGTRECYSDLGYIVLGWALEALEERPLENLARDRIFDPLGLSETRYVSVRRSDEPLDVAVATEREPDRGGVVAGRVHDRNAAALGGVAGHAGCFSTARDLARFGAHLLAIDRGKDPEPALVDRPVLQRSWSETARGVGGHHLVGWDTPSGSPSSSGRGFQKGRTVGHLGFTGSSIWLERDRNLVAVLLTNRVHPSRENDRIKSFRVRFHEEVLPP